MADENILRSYRSNDAARRASAAASAKDTPSSDPLAELARLIGQSDPFADLDRGRGQASPNGFTSQPQSAYGSEAPPPGPATTADWRKTAAAMAREALRESPTTEQHYAQVDSAVAAAQSLRASPADHFAHSDDYAPAAYDQDADPQDPYANPAYSDAAYADTAYADDMAYADGPRPESHFDERSHADLAASAVAQDNENYFFDGAPVPTQPGFYDDPPRPRAANGLVTVLVLVGCGILGTAGAYGYRTYYSGVRTADAPIISADKSPSKIVPASTGGDAQSGKAIQERLGGGNERVVQRQEEPVALPDASSQRVVPQALFPVVPGAVPSPQPASPSTSAVVPPATAAAAGAGPSDSKKVHTISIHPLDGVDPLSRPLTAASNAAPAVPSPQAASPHQLQASRTASAPPHNGGPLSLDPQGQPTPSASSYQPVAPDRARPAPSAPQLASASSSPAGAGGYMVQISSQRSEADAQASIRSLQSKYASQLGDREAVVRRADLGDKGVYYRALVGPFGTAGEADQFCGSLKAAGAVCYRLKN